MRRGFSVLLRSYRRTPQRSSWCPCNARGDGLVAGGSSAGASEPSASARSGRSRGARGEEGDGETAKRVAARGLRELRGGAPPAGSDAAWAAGHDSARRRDERSRGVSKLGRSARGDARGDHRADAERRWSATSHARRAEERYVRARRSVHRRCGGRWSLNRSHAPPGGAFWMRSRLVGAVQSSREIWISSGAPVARV